MGQEKKDEKGSDKKKPNETSRILSMMKKQVIPLRTTEEITGVIMVGNDGRRGYIYHTAVSPYHRNKEIGTNLVEKALNSLKNLGITKVALVVFDRNETGNTFWEKQGFSKREDLIYRNKTIIEMVRIDT